MRIGRFILRSGSQTRAWVRAIFGRNRLESAMEAELANHLDLLTADLIRAGHSPQEAARRARIALGTTLTHKEAMRSSLGLHWWDELRADLRYALRLLRKSPAFTLIAASSLALAIGANTAIFSVAKQILYERLQVPRAAELRLLTWVGPHEHLAVHHVWGDYLKVPGGRVTSSSFSYPLYQQLRAQNRSLADLFAFKVTSMNATVRDHAQQVQTEMVSGNYYAQLEVQPQLGRPIQPSDDAVPGQGAVALISDGLWEREFGRSPAVLGQTIKLNDTPLVIVGVNPRGFTGAKDVQQSPDIFVPLAMQPLVRPTTVLGARQANAGKRYADALSDPNIWWVSVMARTRPGVSERQAQSVLDGQMAAIFRGILPVRTGEVLPNLVPEDGSRGLFEQKRIFARPMAVLMTLVGFVLLLACANVANLLLARGAQRQREMTVRLALGAGRARVLRQMFVESLLLASLGGAGGVVLGYFGAIAIPKLTENAWERAGLEVHFDWKIVAFTALITILTGLLFGLAPAWMAARSNVSGGLKETAQTASRRRKGLSGKALVGFQIALSTLLVFGAGLFLRTLAGLSSVDVGFQTDHLLLAGVDLPQAKYPAGKDVLLHQRIEEAFAAVPGVESVTASALAYVADDFNGTDFLPEGQNYDKNKHQEEAFNLGGSRFFETLKIPIVAGRGFGPQDTATSARVAVINEALAKSRFPGQNPIGKRFRTDVHDSDGHGAAADWYQIVGICGNTRYNNLREEPPAQFILHYAQQPEASGMVYQLRTRMKPESIEPSLRSALRRIDPDLPLVDVHTQDQQIDADLEQERLFVTLTSGFGVLALVLAAVGIYGVMAYSVAQRTNEIGIRLTLGARPAQVRGMILRESAWLSIAGIGAGLATALLLARVVRSMLYGVQPHDPATLAASVALLLVVTTASTWLPARRAASVQPMDALRHE